MSTESTERRATNSDATRLFSKTTYTTGELGCREFTGGCLDRDGYGRFYCQGKTGTRPPSRLRTRLWADSTRTGRRSHLQQPRLHPLRTPRSRDPAENNRRAAERRTPRTHCKNGHEYTESSTYHHDGARYCRICNLLAVKRYEMRQRTKAMSALRPPPMCEERGF